MPVITVLATRSMPDFPMGAKVSITIDTAGNDVVDGADLPAISVVAENIRMGSLRRHVVVSKDGASWKAKYSCTCFGKHVLVDATKPGTALPVVAILAFPKEVMDVRKLSMAILDGSLGDAVTVEVAAAPAIAGK